MKKSVGVFIISVFMITITKVGWADWKYVNNLTAIDKKIAEETRKIERELDENNQGERLKQAYIQRSALYGLNGCYEEALSDLYKVLEITPTDSAVYNNIAWMRYKLADYNKALDNANRALEIDPDNYFVLNTRALIYVELDRLDEAMQDIRIAIERNERHGFSYFTRGIIHYSQGKKNLACHDFQRARTLDKNLQQDIDRFRAQNWQNRSHGHEAVSILPQGKVYLAGLK
ncbi:MAG: tetratricopeptide repeat protein [Candidatus Omnitrophota bacterium]